MTGMDKQFMHACTLWQREGVDANTALKLCNTPSIGTVGGSFASSMGFLIANEVDQGCAE